MITITEKGAQKIKEILKEQGLDAEKVYLRLQVVPGGCSGYSYAMDIDTSKSESDVVFEHYGVKVVVDPTSLRFLEGSEIDYVSDLMGGGFSIKNPKAVSSCGCGKSFDVEDTE